MIKFQAQKLEIHVNEFTIICSKLIQRAQNYCLLWQTADTSQVMWPGEARKSKQIGLIWRHMFYLPKSQKSTTHPPLKFYTAKCDPQDSMMSEFGIDQTNSYRVINKLFCVRNLWSYMSNPFMGFSYLCFITQNVVFVMFTLPILRSLWPILTAKQLVYANFLYLKFK